MSEEKEDEPIYEDARWAFLTEQGMKSLNCPQERWTKFLASETNHQLIDSFFTKMEIMKLFFYWQGPSLEVSTELPTSLKKKGFYFAKFYKDIIDSSEDKMLDNLTYGDLPNLPAEHLSAFVDEILVSVLVNTKNHKKWPAVVTDDVCRQVYKIKNEVFVFNGQIKGQTLLPIPAGMENYEQDKKFELSSRNRTLLHQVETSIIAWSQYINDILKQDSTKNLIEGTHPTPDMEISFWESRHDNLEYVYKQLLQKPVKKMSNILNVSGSIYHSSLQELIFKVNTGLEEAWDIKTHLRPLRVQLDQLDQTEFDEITPKLRPLLHVISLIWINSKHYNTPSRIILLLKEVCNYLIDLASLYLSPEDLLKSEVDDALGRVTVAIKVLKTFKVFFLEFKAKINSKKMQKGDGAKPLVFPVYMIFQRYDSFLKRLHLLKEFFVRSHDFLKLEKVEFSGLHGRNFSALTQKIYETFKEIYAQYGERAYNPLDPDDPGFSDDMEPFDVQTSDLEIQLANILCRAFDDCSGLLAVFKLLNIFGNVVERPSVKKDFNEKYPIMLDYYYKDLSEASLMFDRHVEASEAMDENSPSLLHPCVHRNMPPVAGQLQVCKELTERILWPLEWFKHINHACFRGEHFNRIHEQKNKIIDSIQKFCEKVYNKWTDGLEEASNYSLKQYLLTRPKPNQIEVNLNPQLVAVLREVSYLQSLGINDIPEVALNLYDKNHRFMKYVTNLNLIVESYNETRRSLLMVETPLVADQFKSIDQILKVAEEHLKWDDDHTDVNDDDTEDKNEEGLYTKSNLWSYIQGVRDTVQDLSTRVQKTKENVDKIKAIMEEWTKISTLERKQGNVITLLDLEGRKDRVAKKYAQIEADGVKIHKYVEENLYHFMADNTSDKWNSYKSYIDGMVIKGFLQCISASLYFLLDNTEPTVQPLFTADLELKSLDMVFNPSLNEKSTDGFFALINGILQDIYGVSRLVKRVSVTTNQEHYLADMESAEQLTSLKSTLMRRINDAFQKAYRYSQEFAIYSNLWVDDRKQLMSQFLTYGRILTAEDMESAAYGIEEKAPTLEQFKEQIDSYEYLYNVVNDYSTSQVFNGWFIVHIKPFIVSLLNVIKRWSFMFKEHLISHVSESLTSLKNFISETNEVLNIPLEIGQYDELVKCMEHLNGVKDRMDVTDEMFEPLKLTIDLLKTYDQEMSEEVHSMLQELPEMWANTKKLAVVVKQKVAPLQANEVAQIRRKSTSFDMKQNEFRERFKKEPIFKFQCKSPYTRLDMINSRLESLEAEQAALELSASIFQVVVPEFRHIKTSRKDIVLCKQTWDLCNLVTSSTNAWNSTKWADINVEQMDLALKKFAKDIRVLDKEAKSWDLFTGLDGLVKNMMTSLRAVGELQNPAIRDRHWKEVMAETKVIFKMDSSTTLADLLQLNLHKYEDEVREIVDKAVKEMGMEKTLREMDATWKTMSFEYEKHNRASTSVIVCSEELLETLEENQVQLQNLMTSKFISHFLEEVSAWVSKLSLADAVLSVWLEVQRTWSHLESIFIGSDDIRSQLPQDSERFDRIDKAYKEIMKDAITTPNVIKATNKPGLQKKLESLKENLTHCEKALAEYLETKRLAFPRFYFVSSSDLLDILSNGNNPAQVTKHLAKIFDNICKLEFVKDDEGNLTKKALSMYSAENENVEFISACDCVGQVEVWLNRLLDRMRATVRHLLSEAVVTYDEKPRDQWIFDYAAQIALTTTQIWWSSEMGISFSRLEEGYENALKDYFKKQVSQLNALIGHLVGKLSPNNRQSIMTICTIDVHARDVVSKLIQNKVDASTEFLWQSQLRHRWADTDKHCYGNICDAQFQYSYEYLGNQPRLVITPLTDRCYITLTQSLHLIMGGAPAGPAGTGKTETTKDLGRSLAVRVYVFNCSEQMDYKSVGNIYKGLAQTGAWGCFDEFNRISVEVLSVVAVQVKSIQDAIKNKKVKFFFQGEEINLVPSVGIFITMNPGYAGRTELPENLKALFRPCAMVVPDFELICEIMLVAEGFIEARILARKFLTLYTLCKELLSKQDHYDWGLRAIKSVLVVAGALKRDDTQRPEDEVLMRALRDFNTPKIVTDDIPVFIGLIGDLFPSLDVPRKRVLSFEESCKSAVQSLKLQAEDSFVLKLVQLDELLFVRHSVFVIGNAGTGKTQVLKSLYRCYQNQKKKPIWIDLNPKAVTNNELFGIISPATREWKDGLFSNIMRDLSNISNSSPKWIVLDGDIDPMWIESLNTVMDDNKVLTLASNERIPLTPSMRLLFEISNLRTATPATVSRAGILYLNPADLGWNPMVLSWIDRRTIPSEKSNLTILFDKYVPSCIEACRQRFYSITPIPECAKIQMLCYLLECLLTPTNAPSESPKELYELYFVFACIWAFGGSLFMDQIIDYRVEFSKWWLHEFKSVKIPTAGTIFDYCIDPATNKFVLWSDFISSCDLNPDIPLQTCMVSTSETKRIRYFIDLLMEKRRPVMLVGNAGTGKTVLVQDKLESLNDKYMVTNVPFNFYTTSLMLQRVLEGPLEKKAGRNYGPPGTNRMVYFIDDLNMPEVDTYGTVQPHTLIRQHLDYSHWYDRNKLTLKTINNVQYVACMNPTAGSFTINPRLQRHFCVFAVSFPGKEALTTIYSSILNHHFVYHSFHKSILAISDLFVNAALAFHAKISSTFLPTAIKFHYTFNLRDLSNFFQGVLYSTPDCFKSPFSMARLWMHEASRVYSDKLVDHKDLEVFNNLRDTFAIKFFEDLPKDALVKEPLLFCHFAKGIGESKYDSLSWSELNKTLKEALYGYNEANAAMNLVLFEDAMSHVVRINRILESPRGNALLVGVGGSGKQSLSRLAAYISGLEVFQITVRKGYSINDLKIDLANLYIRAGMKNVPTMFLLTDAQIGDEQFLVLVNDLLASGEIPDLFDEEGIENIISSVRVEVKSEGLEDSRENCWKFFISRVRQQLKVVLCFSPVGSTLRVRGRKFPAVVNCTQIDWFQEWPKEALESVSRTFVQEISLIAPSIKPSISEFMSFVHTSVNEASSTYLANERRYNYTTPKSFLEQINLYKNLLEKKSEDLKAQTERLENGIMKLLDTAEQVDNLKRKLASQEIELQQKNEDADKLIQVVGVETDKVSKEKEVADKEELKVAVFAKEVGIRQQECERDLAKAEPALIAAKEALNTLNKNNLTELKSFGAPPNAVVQVTAAVMVLLCQGKVPKDRSWKACKGMMAKVDHFLESLITYDKEHIHENSLKAIRPYLAMKEFHPDLIRGKSSAAAGLCAWCINIVKFYEVYCDVQPKRLALEKANSELRAAEDKLQVLKDKITELNANLAELTNRFELATEAKLRCQQEADQTALTISLSNRLVNGLASENIRWKNAVSGFKEKAQMLCGDVLLITAFISYAGYFVRSYRTDFLKKLWLPFLQNQKVQIPITENLDPISVLTDDADIAAWNNEGLPSDRMSTENAAILINCQRWPLIIDPQLQGIRWIKKRFKDLKVVRLGQKGYLDVIEKGLSNGDVVLIENVGENIDPVLTPVLSRETIKRGKYIKIGDKEVSYNPKFKLILQTKLANPHYQPELQAQCTLINFTVTKNGLEEQLLVEVVKSERPDLEETKAALTIQQNDFKITLKRLEDSLLSRLSSASGNFLGDIALVENLETTKQTAAEIEIKVAEAIETEIKINEAREFYRPVATRAAILYFILNDLNTINPIYQFSLKAFNVVFSGAINRSELNDDLKVRVKNLIETTTFSVFQYTARGLFECDKLTFIAQVALQVLLADKEIDQSEMDFLLRFPVKIDGPSPIPFITDYCWGGIRALSETDTFRGLDKDIESSSKRWKKFAESECPEKEKFPQEWKNKNALQKLCMMRALRPDRMTYAVKNFVEDKLGPQYIENRSIEFAKSFEESGPASPIFFVLSPGVDPLKEVEALGYKIGFTTEKKNFHNVSLGQGQEIVAEEALDLAAAKGHWVVLQNVHLVAKWLSTLEKKLETYSMNSHRNYRVFISAEPASTRENHIIPQGILESSIKITSEPPTGMQANLHKALDCFSQETLEMCSREVEFKSLLQSLCYFHAVLSERKKFGAQGWNRCYPFNVGDLTICVNVLYNYLEASSKVPWDDLRYLFCEIMYGGHITDDWDRKLCRTYLEVYMHPDQLESELLLAPGYQVPPNMDYKGYHAYIDEYLPAESPYLYGLHPNAEIGVLTTTSENLFKTLLEMQPKDATGAGSGSSTREETVKTFIDEVLDKLPATFKIQDMLARVADRNPYVVVAFQECERMNSLTSEIKRSLKELELGLKGELTVTSAMEDLENSLFLDKIPDLWIKKAYASTAGLSAWVADLILRIKELDVWTTDFALPNTVWLGGLFNPQSFLTAIMQSMARKNEWPLDKMCLQCDPIKKSKEDVIAPPREGSYIHGLYMEGARWDTQTGFLAEARLKELLPPVPVLYIRAIPIDRQETRNMYGCPVYKTKQRGPTYVWTFNLKTKEKPSKWILAGAALLLQI